VRVQALARRGRPGGDSGQPRLDPARHAVVHEATEVPLTPTEYRLLARLMSAPGDVVRRQTLIAAAWPMGAAVHDNTLDSYVRRLRREVAALDGHEIRTVRGVGYSWR